MELTPRDRILLIAGVALPLLLIVSFLVLGPDGGEDLALPTGPPGATGTTEVATAPPTLSPSPTPRETLPPVSLAGSRDPFSIPAGLELSTTGGSVSPTTTASSGATFDDNFELVKIDGECAKFLFGDQSFELCET